MTWPRGDSFSAATSTVNVTLEIDYDEFFSFFKK